MKKIISLIFCAMMILSVCSIIPASAVETTSTQEADATQETVVVGDFQYEIMPNHTATVTKYLGDNSDVRIPEEFSYNDTTYHVEMIAGDVFVGTNVKSTVIPDDLMFSFTDLGTFLSSFDIYANPYCIQLASMVDHKMITDEK